MALTGKNNEEKVWKVYMYINKTNNKKYIGQTKNSLKSRAGKNGNLYKQCVAFGAAIEKYGWDNFESKILKDNLTREEANDYEKEMIAKYKTTDPKYGYNISKGGADNTYTSIDITGQRFGKWTALYLVDTPPGAIGRHWMCRCDCGTMKIIRQDHLRSGASHSCGCSWSDPKGSTPNDYEKIDDDYYIVHLKNIDCILDEYGMELIKGKRIYYEEGTHRIVTTIGDINFLKLLCGVSKRNLNSYISYKNGNKFDLRRSNIEFIIPDDVDKDDYMAFIMSKYPIRFDPNNKYKKYIISQKHRSEALPQFSFHTFKEAEYYYIKYCLGGENDEQ